MHTHMRTSTHLHAAREMSRYICPTVDTTPSEISARVRLSVDMPREVNPRPSLPRRSSSTRRLLWGMLSSKSSLNDEERGEQGGREGGM